MIKALGNKLSEEFPESQTMVLLAQQWQVVQKLGGGESSSLPTTCPMMSVGLRGQLGLPEFGSFEPA